MASSVIICYPLSCCLPPAPPPLPLVLCLPHACSVLVTLPLSPCLYPLPTLYLLPTYPLSTLWSLPFLTGFFLLLLALCLPSTYPLPALCLLSSCLCLPESAFFPYVARLEEVGCVIRSYIALYLVPVGLNLVIVQLVRFRVSYELCSLHLWK